MISSSLRIRQAHVKELGQVLRLYNDTAHWLVKQGIEQWPYPVPHAFSQHIEDELTHGEVYLARLSSDPNPVGVAYLRWTKHELWPDDEAHAGYLYGLAVHPRVRGRAIGTALLTWLAKYVKRQGRAYVRLDCLATNKKLRQYYRDQGFYLHGLASLSDFDRALYEKQLEL